MSTNKILIVEDYLPLAESLEYQVKRAGYEVYRASDGKEALEMARLYLPDVILLDIDLPLLSGIEVCKQLRANPKTRDILILMLTAMGEESDQVVGFAVGADDYVVKPVESYKVLLQRIKALLRRREPVVDDSDSFSHRDVTVDRRRFVVSIGGDQLKLTKSEFRLLETLIRQPGRAFGRSELVDAALGEDTIVLDRTIDVHVRALRKKMGDAADLIETVRGVGYRFKE
ncbi:winged helix-turn-helix domain-containing protein [Stieleria varia]|uniref:Phosphate regulon transcriptional regulatory protein PhoB n=1 Tax=Stieleria varia TaxID=2528005 RepID=A0A5C6B9Y6_9BACT|nr:winged helix-turn-helix domain-containing protein [Stieleria varia]TWU08537.1 Phosphate regulon transcriptional regulatory protein PhoB [Stieleria varia]